MDREQKLGASPVPAVLSSLRSSRAAQSLTGQKAPPWPQRDDRCPTKIICTNRQLIPAMPLNRVPRATSTLPMNTSSTNTPRSHRVRYSALYGAQPLRYLQDLTPASRPEWSYGHGSALCAVIPQHTNLRVITQMLHTRGLETKCYFPKEN